MSFLQFTDDNQELTVFGQTVKRSRFGNHLRLGELQIKIDRALVNGRSKEASSLISAYFIICEFEPSELNGDELLIAYHRLSQLNQIKALLPFQLKPPQPGKTIPYDYEGRMWALWVHKIASAYGWTRHYIFNELWPEEVATYFQEITVSEWNELDKDRHLSQTSWEYDKFTKKHKFIPTTPYPWMIRDKEPVLVHKKSLPLGEIVRLG